MTKVVYMENAIAYIRLSSPTVENRKWYLAAIRDSTHAPFLVFKLDNDTIINMSTERPIKMIATAELYTIREVDVEIHVK